MRNPIDWRDHFIRFFFITLGVFLGFGLNTCNSNQKEKAQVDLYLDGLVDELKENQQILNESLTYHKHLLEQLQNETAKANLILNPAHVSNISWTLANNEVFKKHLDNDLYKNLSLVYQYHQELIDLHNETSRLMSEMNVLGPLYSLSIVDKQWTREQETELDIIVKLGWVPIFETWTSTEELYLKHIESVLNEIENR